MTCTDSELRELARAAVAHGRWMIRADNDGVSYSDFRWPAPGEWVTAPDWNDRAECYVNIMEQMGRRRLGDMGRWKAVRRAYALDADSRSAAAWR